MDHQQLMNLICEEHDKKTEFYKELSIIAEKRDKLEFINQVVKKYNCDFDSARILCDFIIDKKPMPPTHLSQAQIAQINAKERARQTAPVPRCPMCGSTDIQKISDLSRASSILGFGILSKKIGKQWQCNNPKCKHLW